MRIGKKVARQMASQGRGGDSMLVHMHPSEVKALAGLGALAGTPMTRNPTTGLPEAFSLRNTLALVAPIAATMAFGPMAGAAVSGLSTYAATGDPRQAAMSGIAAGALGSALSGAGGAGSTAASTGATDVAAQQGSNAAAQQVATDTLGEQAASNSAAGLTPTFANSADAAAGNAVAQQAAPTATQAAAPTAFSDMSLGQKMDTLKNANWTGKGGMLFNEQGGLKAAPVIAGGAYMGLQGLNDQQQMLMAQQRAAGRSHDDTQSRFDYYKRMANTMPANQIPAYF